MSAEPTLVELKRSLLVQLTEYNRLQSTLSANRILIMRDDEVETICDLLLELSDNLEDIHDRIQTMSAIEGGGDRINN